VNGGRPWAHRLAVVARRALIALALVVLAGAAWETYAEHRDRSAWPPPGRIVDAGDVRLHVLATGREHPGPTVVLETGIGGATSATWAWVQRGVSLFAPCVSYDRAGLGWSAPGPLPRDGARLAAELHTALARAGLHGPYVLVGHSYGGLLARLFTARWPGEVAGIVLVESSHPGQFDGRGMAARVRRILWALRAAPALARVGVMRITFAWLATDLDRLPPRERAEQRAFMSSASQWGGIVRELAAWNDLTNPEARATGTLGDRPLAVVTAGLHAGARWRALQDDLAGLSRRSEHVVVAGATHGSLVADPGHARRVVAAIADVVGACRGAAFPPAGAPTGR
jgi:pimeloyl-ACP methyl ester carboxylesterase